MVPQSKDGTGAFSPPRTEEAATSGLLVAQESSRSGSCSPACGGSSPAASAAGSASSPDGAAGDSSAAGWAAAGASSAAGCGGLGGLLAGVGSSPGVDSAAARSLLAPRGALRAAPAPSRGCAGGALRRRRDDRRRARVDLEDPEAQHAVGNPQVVVQIVEQPSIRFEAEEAIVRLGALLDLVGELARTPGRVLLEGAAGLDPRSRFRRDLLPAFLRDVGIEHQDELVFAGGTQSGATTIAATLGRATNAGVVVRDGRRIPHSLATRSPSSLSACWLPGLDRGPAEPDSAPRAAAAGAGHRAGTPAASREPAPSSRRPAPVPSAATPRAPAIAGKGSAIDAGEATREGDARPDPRASRPRRAVLRSGPCAPSPAAGAAPPPPAAPPPAPAPAPQPAVASEFGFER